MTVGALRATDAGSRVRLAGWVNRRRDLGGLIFIDLRDRSGLVQLSFGPDWTPADVLERAKRLGAEWVVAVEGTVVQRPQGNQNLELATGAVEIHVDALDVLAESATPPIPVARAPGDELPAEELRLRYRYLDLRREELQRALHVRHRAFQTVRRHLSGEGFWEVDTPMLTRRTPEGARDYLVPSRVHPGEFYALPQSPQIYKQLLMVSGYDRYFQIARCLRDEDLRADGSRSSRRSTPRCRLSTRTTCSASANGPWLRYGVRYSTWSCRCRSRGSRTATRWNATARTSRTSASACRSST
jgi:aspartyl-tRNA synthetase